MTVDELAQEIRRVDGNNALGAGALAEALMPFLAGVNPTRTNMTSPEKLATPETVMALIHSFADCYAARDSRASNLLVKVRAEVEALATQRQGEGDGWQSIETAPKDGRTLLLGYFNSSGKWRTLRGQWFSEAHINENWEEECEEGWYETSVECGDDVNCWKTEPTHFKFLPTAPGATSKD